MILIISFLDNEHVQRVTQHLTAPFEVVDQGWFPSSLALSVHADESRFDAGFRLPDGRMLDLTEVRAVWYRRLRPLTLDDALTDNVTRTFAWSESNEALQGMFYSLRCYWMNHPTARRDGAAQGQTAAGCTRGGPFDPRNLHHQRSHCCGGICSKP